MLSNQIANDLLVAALEKLWVELRHLRLAHEKLVELFKEDMAR